MRRKVAITVQRSPEEVRRLWSDPDYRPEHIAKSEAAVSFTAAPGDRGTEIVVELQASGPAGKVVQTVVRSAPLARVKDELRRFKQLVETGEIPRSDGVPEGEHVGRRLKQRPAQPLKESELEKAGA